MVEVDFSLSFKYVWWVLQPSDFNSEEESDDDSEYSEASEDSGDTEGGNFHYQL